MSKLEPFLTKLEVNEVTTNNEEVRDGKAPGFCNVKKLT